MDNGLLITLICVLGGGFVVILNEMNKKKSSKAKEMLESGSVVIDVRTPEEFNSGHYMNSINIPLDFQYKITNNGHLLVVVSVKINYELILHLSLYLIFLRF